MFILSLKQVTKKKMFSQKIEDTLETLCLLLVLQKDVKAIDDAVAKLHSIRNDLEMTVETIVQLSPSMKRDVSIKDFQSMHIN